MEQFTHTFCKRPLPTIFDRLTHVLFADTFNYNAAQGLRYIVQWIPKETPLIFI